MGGDDAHRREIHPDHCALDSAMRLKRKLAPGAVGSEKSAAPFSSKVIELRIHNLKLESLANKRWHWAKRRKYNQSVAWVVIESLLKLGNAWPLNRLLGKAKVIITRHGPRELDFDNLASSVKPVLDALKGRLIVDDSPKYIDLEVRQIKGPYQVDIEILPLE